MINTVRQESGFSLVELMVALVVFVFAIAAATGVFIPLVNQFKQQSKIAETQIERTVGLDLLRLDLEHAGFGLPWDLSSDEIEDTDNDGTLWDELTGYVEAAAPYDAYNDAPDNAPRAIVVGNDVGDPIAGLGMNNSDYLVIKSTLARTSDEAQKWSFIFNYDSVLNLYYWGDAERDPDPNTQVFAIRPASTGTEKRFLITYVEGTDTFFSTTYGDVPNNLNPLYPDETYIVYAVVGPDYGTNVTMPFNRADYYIASTNVPSRCAGNTGVLVKRLIRHGDGSREGGMPLLDCVADFQVVFGLDIDEDGTVGTYADFDNGVSAPSDPDGEVFTLADIQATLNDAELLRKRLKEVWVYILVHEGQYDRFYSYGGAQNIAVGNFKNLDLSTITPNWRNYRWKLYTMVVKPENLGE